MKGNEGRWEGNPLNRISRESEGAWATAAPPFLRPSAGRAMRGQWEGKSRSPTTLSPAPPACARPRVRGFALADARAHTGSG